jgi:hypothetical protein
MARRLLNFVSVVSTVMLAFAVLLFLAGYFFHPSDYSLTVSDDCHVGVWGRGFDSRIVFFNDREYGPYRGSIIGLTDADGNLYPPLEEKAAFGDSWGIYYRYFRWSDSTLWTLMVSLWYAISLFAIVPGIRLMRRTSRISATDQ